MLLNGIDKVPDGGQPEPRARTIFIRRHTHQITAQPSASWKLSAISVPFCSVQTINVSDRVKQSVKPIFPHPVTQFSGYGGTETLLFLVAIIFGDLRLQQDAIGMVLRFDIYSRLLLLREEEKNTS